MGIMHSLLFPVWQHEEQRKQSSFHEKLNRITDRLFRRIVAPPTPLQKKIIRWCGGDVPLAPELTGQLGASNSMQSYLNQQPQLQQAAMNTGMLILPSSQIQNAVHYQGGNVTMVSSAPGSNQLTLGSSQITNAQAMYVAPGQIWYNQVTSSATFPGWPYIFQLLRGIEERCRKADIHRYDEDAVYMIDHRMIDREIPILWLTSFCISNRQDPEMAIVVLEEGGYVIVEGDDDGF